MNIPQLTALCLNMQTSKGLRALGYNVRIGV